MKHSNKTIETLSRKHAKEILKGLGIDETSSQWSNSVYVLMHNIYRTIKDNVLKSEQKEDEGT